MLSGFEVLAFPCNQFMGQEPKAAKDVATWACSMYEAEFPIFDKIDVNGKKQSPIYTFLKKAFPGTWSGGWLVFLGKKNPYVCVYTRVCIFNFCFSVSAKRDAPASQPVIIRLD